MSTSTGSALSGAALVAAVAALLAPAAAQAATPTTCRDTSPSCTIKWAAGRSGIWAGTAIDDEMPAGQLTDTLAHYNAFTTENAFKWSVVEPTQGSPNWTKGDALVAFATANRLRIRGHTLLWHRMQTPSWVKQQVTASPDRQAKLRELITAHVTQVVGRYRGRVQVWDVANEPLALFGSGWDLADGVLTPANFFYNTLGEQYLDLAFRTARTADPKAKLFLNEIVWNPAIGDAKADSLLALVKRLKQRNVPIDGVGLQMHAMLGAKEPMFSGSSTKLTAYMTALAKLGVKVEVTELDVSLPQVRSAYGSQASTRSRLLDLQAAVYRRVVEPCAKVTACTGVTVWGLRDPDSWLDTFGVTSSLAPHEPLPLDAAGARKPAYRALRDSLLKRCTRTTARRNPCSTRWPSS